MSESVKLHVISVCDLNAVCISVFAKQRSSTVTGFPFLDFLILSGYEHYVTPDLVLLSQFTFLSSVKHSIFCTNEAIGVFYCWDQWEEDLASWLFFFA